jgi:hypothetical protein
MTLADDSSDSRSMLYLQKVNPDGIPEYRVRVSILPGIKLPFNQYAQVYWEMMFIWLG